LYRAVYEELGKYGDLENQVLCRERVEELEPSIRYCRHKIGESNLKTSELLQIGELDLFKAKLEVRFDLLSEFVHDLLFLFVSPVFCSPTFSVFSSCLFFYSVAFSFEKLIHSRMFILDHFKSSLYYTHEWFWLHWILSRTLCYSVAIVFLNSFFLYSIVWFEEYIMNIYFVIFILAFKNALRCFVGCYGWSKISTGCIPDRVSLAWPQISNFKCKNSGCHFKRFTFSFYE